MKSVEYTDRLPTIKITPSSENATNAIWLCRKPSRKRFPALSWAIMSNGGHMAFVDQPKLYEQAVDEFLEEKP